MVKAQESLSEIRRSVLWQKAQDLAAEVIATMKGLPLDRALDIIADQLLRCVTSIAANVAEGSGRYSQPAYRNHLSIARGSAFETESLLDRLISTDYLSSGDGEKLIVRSKELQKLLTSRMKSLGGSKTYAVREREAEYEF